MDRRLNGRRLLLSGAMFAGGSALLAATLAAPGSAGHGIRSGGTFRIADTSVDFIDPALTLGGPQTATCAQLMNYADKNAPAGLRVVPDAASGYTVSRDGKTYTFTIRKGLRFNTGARLGPANFAHEINRLLQLAATAPYVQYAGDIVGADAVMAGTAATASGVRVRGNTLVIRLKHPTPDFPARMTLPEFCAVPANLPADPEGAAAPLPSAGPYYVAEYVPGRSLVLKRNRFYGGSRPHHVDTFVTTFVDSYETALGMVQRGEADYTPAGGLGVFDSVPAKVRKSKRFFRRPGAGIRYLAFNTTRPLFRRNVELRRAVNFAIDRSALVREEGGADAGEPFDHYLPPIIPGYRRASIYPLRKPNVKRALALARGHTRGGQVVLYTRSRDPYLALAQIVSANLQRIGLHVTVKSFPGSELFRRIITNPREHWDIAFFGFGPDYIDPYSILNVLLDGRRVGKPGSFNFGHFNSVQYNRRLARAAELRGAARYRAYGELDLDLARNAAPLAVYANERVLTLVSKRTGCIVLNPFLDLAAVCLK